MDSAVLHNQFFRSHHWLVFHAAFQDATDYTSYISVRPYRYIDPLQQTSAG
jgi:hypothetical protein